MRGERQEMGPGIVSGTSSVPLFASLCSLGIKTLLLPALFFSRARAIGWGLGLGQLPDFYHFSAITGSCQIFTILEQI